jgi:hypothetical protein
MLRTINEVYECIAQHLMDCVDNNWSHITFNVERSAGDVIEYTGIFNTLENKEEYLDVFELDNHVGDDFHELYSIMTEEGDQHKWNRAIFKLTPDGKFSIDFDWDQELADEVAHLNS